VYNAIIDCDQKDNFKILKLLNYIDVSDLQNVTVSFDSRIRVNFGDLYDLSYKIDFMKKNFIEIPKGSKGFLDMSLDQPVFKPE
jgi:cell division protein FtsQ